jgi:hypothetical protein
MIQGDEDIDQDKDIALYKSQNNLTLPQDNLTLPQNNLTLPQENLTPPQNNLTLPQNNLTLPQNNLTLPEENLALPLGPPIEELPPFLPPTGFLAPIGELLLPPILPIEIPQPFFLPQEIPLEIPHDIAIIDPLATKGVMIMLYFMCFT